jgi:hypothetical protein
MSKLKKYTVIQSAEEVKGLLKKDLPPISMADIYQLISERFRVDFTAVIKLLRLLPVFISGKEHLRVRSLMAAQINANEKSQKILIKKCVADLCSLILMHKSIEIRGQFLEPTWRSLVNCNEQFTDTELNLIVRLPHLFNAKLSIKDRLLINQELQQLLVGKDDKDNYLILLGLNTLGYTPLVNTLMLSLHTLFSNHTGSHLSEIVYPRRIFLSAIPVTDRVIDEKIIRCPINSDKYTASENQQLIFGAGLHTCLGAALTNFIWSELTSQLSCIDLKIGSSQIKRDNEVSAKGFYDDEDLADPFLRYKHLNVTFI